MTHTPIPNSIVSCTRFPRLRWRILDHHDLARRGIRDPLPGRIWAEEVTEIPGPPTRLELRIHEIREL